nr:hypothetical protein [Tanacetum cinerariifolium]
MNLLSFIRTTDPTKVRVAERQRVEPRLLETTVGRVVMLLPVASTCASSELKLALTSFLIRGLVGMVKKKKICCCDASGPSHPPKKLREDYGALGGAFAAGKSRFVISSDYSLHSGANIAKAEVDSIARTYSVPGGFYDVSGSDFLIGGIRTVLSLTLISKSLRSAMERMDHDQLFIEFNVGAACQISLSAEVRMRVEYNIREKMRLGYVVDEQAKLLKVRDGEIENLKAHLLLKEVEAAEAIHLRAEVFKFEATEKSLQGAAISKAVEKGMQEGLSAGITHGAKECQLLFNCGTEIQQDASVDIIRNLLRLDDALAERLGLTKSHPHANQLMVPIHHSPDQVIDASALSLFLDVSHSWVRKTRENIASHTSALRGVFVPLSDPLFAVDLEGTKGTSGFAHDTTTTLFVTFVSACTISPISTDDYEVAHVDGQEGASVDGEMAAVENINPFSDVSNEELNILE